MRSVLRAGRCGRFGVRLCLAALLLATVPGMPSAAGAPRVEYGDLSVNLRLRTEGGTTASLQELRGALLVGLTPDLALHADGAVRGADESFRELYLLFERGDHRIRLGRFYLPLGIHDYSELYYVGFVLVPLAKSYALRGSTTYRSERGLLWGSRRGTWSWELALLGEDGSDALAGLGRLIGVAGRAQTSVGRLILGLNAYTGDEKPFGSEQTVRMYGLDGRLSIPFWVFRAEAFAGSVGGRAVSAYYLDALFHPAALPAWTFLARVEAVDGFGLHERYTVGVRHVLRRGLNLSVNWIEDGVEFPSDAGGLNIQLQRTWQF